MDFIDLLCIFHGLKGRMEAWRKVCSRPIEARWPDGGRLENPIGPPDGTPIGQARLKNGHRAFFCRHRAIGPIWARWARGTQVNTPPSLPMNELDLDRWRSGLDPCRRGPTMATLFRLCRFPYCFAYFPLTDTPACSFTT